MTERPSSLELLESASDAAQSTFADTVATIAPLFPDALVCREAVERLRMTGARIPAKVSDFMCVECRLNANPQVDLAFGLWRPYVPALRELPHSLQSTDSWRRVVAFCEEWARLPTFKPFVLHLALEFDVPADARAASLVPLPGVCVGLREEHAAEVSFAQCLEVVEAFSGASLPQPVAETLRRCLDRRPTGVYATYLALFPGRMPPVLRLCLKGFDAPALPGYLRAIGWPGRAEFDPRMANTSADGSGRYGYVHLDIGENVLPRIGIEVDFRGAFLREIVARGLCVPAKRDALFAWPGSSIVRLPHHDGPREAIRRTQYLKAVFDGHGGIEVKAYLACIFMAPSAVNGTTVSISHQGA